MRRRLPIPSGFRVKLAGRLAAALALTGTLLATAACTQEEMARALARDPPLEPLYCYNTLGDPECFAVPQRGQAKRMLNYYGPAPAGPPAWRPPAPLPEYADAPPIPEDGLQQSTAMPTSAPIAAPRAEPTSELPAPSPMRVTATDAVSSPTTPAPAEPAPIERLQVHDTPAAAAPRGAATGAPIRLVPPE